MDVVLKQAGLRPPRNVSLALALFSTMLRCTAGVAPNKAPPDVGRLMSYRLLQPSFTVVSLWLRINTQELLL